MRIWLVDIFEPLASGSSPSHRYAHLVAELRSRGHEVVRWTADFEHVTKRPCSPAAGGEEGVRVLHALPYHANASPKRLLSHAAVALSAGRAFERERQQPDLIVCCWTPVELAAACVRFAKRRQRRRQGRRIAVCLDVLDPWPDSFAFVLPGALDAASDLLLWAPRQLARWTMRRADAVTSISETFLAWAMEKRAGRPCASGIFWPTSSVNATRIAAPRSPGPLRCVFSGTFGAAYDFESVLRAVGVINADAIQVSLELLGDGPRYGEVVDRYGRLPGVRFHGRVGHERFDELLSQAEVGFCWYPPHASTTLTTTFFHYLSYGLAVIATPQPDMRELIAERALGVVCPVGAPLADKILALHRDDEQLRAMRQNALALATEHSIEQVGRRLADFVESI